MRSKVEVLLRENMKDLGKCGDVVEVAPGFARNYLLPRKLALLATDGNRKHIERERAKYDAIEAEEQKVASAIADRIGAIDAIEIRRKVGETEALYGSVTTADITEALAAKGFEIDRRKLILPEAIKTIGTHPVPLKLHRDVTVPLKVQVVKEGAQASTAAPAPAPAEKTE